MKREKTLFREPSVYGNRMEFRPWVIWTTILGVPTVIIVPLFAWAIITDNREVNAFKQRCADRGGHVLDSTDTSTVTTVNGKGGVGVGTTTSTTYYCVGPDGQLWEVR